jgi:hypothetical protein
VLSADGRKIFAPRRKIRRAEFANVWWLVFGPIVESSDKSLAMGQLTFASAAA